MPASRGHLVFQAFTTAVKAVNASKRPRTIHKFAGKQSVQLQGAPLGASVACLDMTELAFDDSEWVFDLGPDAGLDLLELLLQSCNRFEQLQSLALAALHGGMPLHVFGHIGSLDYALVTRIAVAIGFLSVQQTMATKTSLTLAAVPRTVCTKPESASTPA